ncbi:hypothetical protein IR010_03000 [Flavobacterium sp. MR2016-29]|uniref:hypothetical protein n=1 Tax=Flavobacterium sp. MR2016-29 TaxID=2783795 RepID=UPI00188D5392|nr:hypothetical protein [Flavobacterium sp. MR2016-29]MBF4491493.1 hypothetical protein [Flavobacterium sp. MR2016-29]
MKTVFFKNVMPFAVAALGLLGAFATTSMQSAAKSKPFLTAYTLNSSGDCNIPVACGETPGKVCRLNGDTGPQAYSLDSQGDCTQIAFKPQNP